MSSTKKTLKNIVFGLVVILVLVAFNHWSGQGLKSAVLLVFQKPLGASQSFLGRSKQQVVSWFSTGSLLKENEALKSENHALISSRLKITELEKENDFLRKELGVTKKKNLQVAMARIFHQQFDGQFQSSFIDAGSNDGIKAGQPVVIGGEVLYGLVKEVYSDSSLIYLITDPRVALSIKISGSEIMGRSRGALRDGLFLELISNQEEVNPGDLVITSGLDGLPIALTVGRIRTVQADRGELFKAIEVEPQFKGLLIDRVFVLK